MSTLFTFCLAVIRKRVKLRTLVGQHNANSYHKPRILKNICSLMIIVICLQSLKLIPLYLHMGNLELVWPHLINLCAHSLCFILALQRLKHKRFKTARLILLLSFCSYILIACYLWQVNVHLHYYFLLAMFVSIYLFDAQEAAFSAVYSVFFILLFICANIVLPMPSDNYIYPYAWLLNIAKTNAIVFALSCCACASFIQFITLINWQQLKRLESQQKELIHKVFEPTLAKQLMENTGAAVTKSADLCVLFLDICNFTAMTMQAAQLGQQNWSTIYQLFQQFDDALKEIDATRIKVNGDQYILLIGLHSLQKSPQFIVQQGLKAAHILKNLHLVNIKQGLAFGSVTYGVFDMQRPQFDIWGETVITAARLESVANANDIMVNEKVHSYALKNAPFSPEKHSLKGIGDQIVYRLRADNSSDE